MRLLTRQRMDVTEDLGKLMRLPVVRLKEEMLGKKSPPHCPAW